MLNIIFMILLFMVFGKLFLFALKASWGLAKIIVTLVLLPFTLIGLVLGGLLSIAFPILLVVGVISLFMPRS